MFRKNISIDTLSDRINEAFSKYSGNTAIDVNGQTYTYSELKLIACAITKAIAHIGSENAFIGIFAARSIGAYAGICAALMAGYGYMPTNPRFPLERTLSMIEQSGCDTIILSEECVPSFEGIADKISGLNCICLFEPTLLAGRFKNHNFFYTAMFEAEGAQVLRSSGQADPAYLLFTSGSTGTPKGVVVSHANICSYLDYTLDRYQFTAEDRFSQTFDTTFDVSVHDIFVSLCVGGTLCVLPEFQIMAPMRFIQEKKLTVWFSVPAVIMFMAKTRMLQPGSLPTLRISMFIGEGLPVKSVMAWQLAAPGSTIENVYGPTEATVAISNFRWLETMSESECINGIVPIGSVFDRHEKLIMSADEQKQPLGSPGELWLSGPQVTGGYLNNPEQTNCRFVRFEGKWWYKTGDLVVDSNNGMSYLGRIDDQVQIRGFRVELQEVDQVLRAAIGHDMAIAVPICLTESGNVEDLYAFIEISSGEELDCQKIMTYCRQCLPNYMCPKRIIGINKMPLNSNGKINRKALAEYRVN